MLNELQNIFQPQPQPRQRWSISEEVSYVEDPVSFSCVNKSFFANVKACYAVINENDLSLTPEERKAFNNALQKVFVNDFMV